MEDRTDKFELFEIARMPSPATMPSVVLRGECATHEGIRRFHLMSDNPNFPVLPTVELANNIHTIFLCDAKKAVIAMFFGDVKDIKETRIALNLPRAFAINGRIARRNGPYELIEYVAEKTPFLKRTYPPLTVWRRRVRRKVA